MRVKFKILTEGATLPFYATPGASGFDLVAIEDTKIYGGRTTAVKTGLAVEIPEGFEMQIRPRSGLSLKTNLRVANSPGTVDSDYRGEVCVIMQNTLDAGQTMSYQIKKGDRIAQGVIVPVIRADLVLEQEELSDTKRGTDGFGSTGK